MARRLHRRGVLTKLRQSAGQDVDGGCGQLRARDSWSRVHRHGGVGHGGTALPAAAAAQI